MPALLDARRSPPGGVLDPRDPRRIPSGPRPCPAAPANVQARRHAPGQPLASSAPMIARVQPLTTTRRLAGPFDYALPEAPVEVGSIVRVPFGRQKLDGVVVGFEAETDVPPEKLVT